MKVIEFLGYYHGQLSKVLTSPNFVWYF